jgi:hypothetical protein
MPPYLVPLSRQAIEIVRELLKMFIPSQRYLLRSRHRPAMSVDRMTLNKALQQLGYKDRLRRGMASGELCRRRSTRLVIRQRGSKRSFPMPTRTRFVRLREETANQPARIAPVFCDWGVARIWHSGGNSLLRVGHFPLKSLPFLPFPLLRQPFGYMGTVARHPGNQGVKNHAPIRPLIHSS